MMEFQGQSVCVIGGTAGVGLALASGAAARGASVIVVGRDPARAEDAVRRLGSRARSRTADVSDPDAVSALFDEIGPVDHLAVTAAQVRAGAFLTSPVEDARFAFDGKFWPQYLCARSAQVRRSILLCSGVLSRRPWAGAAAIAAVNGAVEALGRALAVELAPIRVNILSPGFVQGTQAYDGMPDESRAAMFAAAAARLPAGLVGDAAAVAGPGLALMASPYATGVVLDVDGGGALV